jgi:hypothetical protein
MLFRDRIRELRRVPASALRPNPRNWRTHPPGQRDALQGLLAEIGFADAALARELPDKTLELIDGHLRAETAGDAPIPVLVLDVDDAEAGKLLATLDPLAGMAEADDAALAGLLAEVETDNAGVQALLDELANESASGGEPELPEPGAGGDEFDGTPEAAGPTRTKAGELWVIGGGGIEHRLLVGDCTDSANVARLMGGEQISLCLTDPPYGIDYGRAGGFSASHGWGKWRENVEWDKERPGREAFNIMIGMGLPMIIWGGNYFTDYLPPSMRWLVWDKGQRDFSLADCELAWTSENKASRVFTYSRAKALQDGKAHPTQKPVALFEWCMRLAGDLQIVYDPFLGSGTTLIAAHRLGRRAFGCEIEPRYADVVLKRCEAEGLTAEKAEG